MTIRVALLSFAHGHQFHWAKAFQEHEHAEMVVAWDHDVQRGRQGAAQVGVEFNEDLSVVLQDPTIDAVAVCSETARHADLVRAAAAAGKHVLCEKPTALALADVDAMQAVVERAGVHYMQAFPQRHLASNQKLLEIVRSGVLGDVSLVRKRHGHGYGLDNLESNMPWIVDAEQAGAGAFFDEGVHECDVLRWLLGDPLSVTAMVSRTLPQAEAWGLDTVGAAIFRFPEGVLASLEAAWTWVAGGPTTEIYGSSGTLVQSFTDVASNRQPLPGAQNLQLYLEAEKERGWQTMSCASPFAGAHRTVARTFVDALTDERAMPVTLADGRAALEMMLGAYTAAEQRREVTFPLKNDDKLSF